MFSVEPFSTIPMGDDGAGPREGYAPVVYFINKTITFPLRINKVAEFDLNLNNILDLSLKRNTILEFTVRR
jgi:hypothetical protein